MKKKKLVLLNPEFPNIGVSEKSITQYPPIGLGIVAAVTPEHWEVVIRDSTFDDLQVEPCDLVGITAMTPQVNSAYHLAEQFRQGGTPVVLGGIHPTLCTGEALNFADAVVKYEAVETWPKVIEDFEKGDLKKVYEPKPGSRERTFKKLPHPAYHLLNPNYEWGLVQTSMGCPLDCEFCAVTAFCGSKYIQRPLGDVLDEIEMIPQKILLFSDDNLLGYGKKAEERFIALCEGMIKRKLKKKWVAQMTANFSKSDEVMRAASEAGCVFVLIGIESIFDDVLKGHMNKTHNIKYIHDGNFIKRIHKYGIGVIGMFIVGNDEDKPDCVRMIYRFIKDYNIDIPTISFLTPFPGTKLWKRMNNEDRLPYHKFPDDWRHFIGTDQAMIVTPQLSKEYLEEEVAWISRKVYSAPSILKRALYALMYSRGNLVTTISTIKGNWSWRYSAWNSTFYKRSGYSSGKEIKV
ncbi:MAG: B12-binding domain-containing radical SAM protein [Candidatus Aminicenantes bacterium]|nr:MAG: B12-binding domain-containing radical SAM protein [Candidatus Aminicenantes bacterium]